MRKSLGIVCLFTVLCSISSASTYKLELSLGEKRDVTSWLKAGGRNQKGDTLGANSLYWTRNGKPWLPVMGEFHFARYPSALWESELLKMKAGGISIVSTYIFWEMVEREPGHWNWAGDNDLRRFVRLCSKHGLYVWLRPGPYVNGEIRQRGIPEWAWKLKARTNDPQYLASVQSYFQQVGKQIGDLTFKNGGPIIGCQLENEFASGSKDHLAELKRIALESGIDVPFFSATANSEHHYERGDILPLQGAYPYRYWEAPAPTGDFLYATDEWGAMANLGRLYYDVNRFPRGMCELGGGYLTSRKWRLRVPDFDMEGSAQNVLGRGCNLVGYYMFHGGTHPNDFQDPDLSRSYDYQAPLGEFGQVRPSYHRLRLLHTFAQSFGELLAPMQPVRPKNMNMDPKNVSEARFIGRFQGRRGFVFATTCQPHVKTQDVKNVQFQIDFGGSILTFPKQAVTIPKNSSPIFPVGLDINGSELRYSTAQLLAKIPDPKTPTYVFFAVPGINPEFELASGTARVSHDRKPLKGTFQVQPARSIAFNTLSVDGRKAKVIVLTQADALHAWVLTFRGRPSLVISDGSLAETVDGKGLEITSESPKVNLAVYSSASTSPSTSPFASYSVSRKDVPAMPRNAETGTSVDISIPTFPSGVSDILVRAEYTGSSAELFAGNDKVPYTDNLLVGDPFEFSLRRFRDIGLKKLRITATPWDKGVVGIPASSEPKNEAERAGNIRSVKFVPLYQFVLR